MKMGIVLGALCLLLPTAGAAWAETHLAGDISATTFNSSSGPFVVEQEIVVPANKRVVVGAGCVFLFKPMTSLTINGTFVAQGTAEQPVLFTSIADTVYAKGGVAGAFDWDGIAVASEAAEARFGDCRIKYSTFGISSLTERVSLRNCIFRQNGLRNFSIKDRPLPVIEGRPFVHGDWPGSDGPTAAPGPGGSQQPPAKLAITSDPPGATVFIDGAEMQDRTPFAYANIAPGKRLIVVSKDALTAAQTVDLVPGESREISVKLHRLPTTLHLQSDPRDAEVYFKAPGRHSFAKARTPATLRVGDTATSRRIWLLKKGFQDTVLDVKILPATANEYFCALRPIARDGVGMQSVFFHRRTKYRWSLVTGGMAVGGAVAGAAFLVSSHADYEAAAAAKKWCDEAVVKSGPEYDAHLQKNHSKLKSGNRSLADGIVLAGTAALLLGATIVLQF